VCVRIGACVPSRIGACVPSRIGACVPSRIGACVPSRIGACVPSRIGACVPSRIAGACIQSGGIRSGGIQSGAFSLEAPHAFSLEAPIFAHTNCFWLCTHQLFLALHTPIVFGVVALALCKVFLVLPCLVCLCSYLVIR